MLSLEPHVSLRYPNLTFKRSPGGRGHANRGLVEPPHVQGLCCPSLCKSGFSEEGSTVAQVHPTYLPAPYQDSAASGRLILRDGSTATIRLVQPRDRDALVAFFNQLSP